MNIRQYIVAVFLLCLTTLVAQKAEAVPYAYATDAQNNAVVKIDTATNTVLSSIPVGNTPSMIAITPDGRYAYVINYDDKTISKITLATETVETTFQAGTQPWTLAITPDGKSVYVTDETDSNIYKIDTSTNLVSATIPIVGPASGGIAITPDGKSAYVTLPGNTAVAKINTETSAVTNILVGTFPFGIAITLDGTAAYVVNSGDLSISKINIATNSVVTPISSLPSTPTAIAITPDGKYLYVTHMYSGIVSKIDTANYSITQITTTGADPSISYSIAITPDGTKEYVPSAAVTMYVIENDVASPISGGTVQGMGIAIVPNQTPTPQLPPLPPSHFKGHRLKNKHTIRLKWKKRPNQSVAQYKITRNKHKTFFVPALDKPRFTDHHRKTYKRYLYSIKAVDAAGNKSHAKWTHIDKKR